MVYPNTPCRLNPDISKRSKRRAGKKVLQEAHYVGPFKHLTNRKSLILFLKENPNKHNDFVLSLILREEQYNLLNQKLEGQVSKHHVLPLHDSGSPERWNIITVKKEEHDIIHRYRYEVYQQKADFQASFATQASVLNSVGIHNKKKKKVANFGILNIAPEVSFAIQKGMRWKHCDGYEDIIQPNSVSTVQEILQILIESLPDGHLDKDRLKKTANSTNYIRRHIITSFPVENPIENLPNLSKPCYTAYHFKVISF
jgi:hypothetical protein